jgi:hypothetical protein
LRAVAESGCGGDAAAAEQAIRDETAAAAQEVMRLVGND